MTIRKKEHRTRLKKGLYAVRTKKGRFKDIQKVSRTAPIDISKKAKTKVIAGLGYKGDIPRKISFKRGTKVRAERDKLAKKLKKHKQIKKPFALATHIVKKRISAPKQRAFTREEYKQALAKLREINKKRREENLKSFGISKAVEIAKVLHKGLDVDVDIYSFATHDRPLAESLDEELEGKVFTESKRDVPEEVAAKESSRAFLKFKRNELDEFVFGEEGKNILFGVFDELEQFINS